MLPRRGLDEFVTGSAAPPAAAKGQDASKKDEKSVEATSAGRPWKAAELRRMYQRPRLLHFLHDNPPRYSSSHFLAAAVAARARFRIEHK